jgi:broad specificity phosphatase PhoE
VLNVVLVRHGATSWNEQGYCQGHKDVQLSERGREQARRLRAFLGEPEFDHAFASPLRRAQETARLLGSEPEVLADLTEIDRGHWEGHPAAEIERRWGKLHRAWYADPRGLSMPGGEAFDDLWERAGRVLAHWEGLGEGRVLACAHKAVNRVIVARALGRSSAGVWGIPQPQACRNVLVHEDGTWRAERIGDTAHLPDEMRSES